MTSKPQPFTNEKFESLCLEVKEIHAQSGLLSMLVTARFKEHIKVFLNTSYAHAIKLRVI